MQMNLFSIEEIDIEEKKDLNVCIYNISSSLVLCFMCVNSKLHKNFGFRTKLC